MEKEKREAHRKECVCVCVCTNESVSCCGNGLGWMCFQRERESHDRFLQGRMMRDLSRRSSRRNEIFFSFFVSSLKELNFLKLRDFIDFNLYLFFRHTLACFVWQSTPTRGCPFTRRRSLICTRARNDTKCLRTSSPSPIRLTGPCCKVCVSTVFFLGQFSSSTSWLLNILAVFGSPRKQQKTKKEKTSRLPCLFACSFWGNVKPGHIW